MSAGTTGTPDAVRSTDSPLFGMQERRETTVQFNVHERTVRRWERQGLPVTELGAKRLHDPASVRAWLLERARKQDTPRRGRPAKGKS